MKKKLILVGSGVSGLASLYYFLKSNADTLSCVKIYEKSDRIGGVLNATEENGFLLEHGAQGVLSRRENFCALIKELGIEDRVLIASPESSQRAFFFKNRIIFLSPKNIVKIFQTGLLSVLGFLRIFLEFFVPKNTHSDETVHSFFARRFGKQIAQHFIVPVMKGIWGGGASKILLKYAFPKLNTIENNYRSILRYTLISRFTQGKNKKSKKEMISFIHGMQELPQALLEKIKKICNQNNVQIDLIFNHHEKLNESCDLLIYSAQPWRDTNAPLIFSHPDFKILKSIPTHTLVVVGIGSNIDDVNSTLNGFGALAVETNPEGVLGAISVHSLYKKHVPNNSFFYRVILGGENTPNHIDLQTASDKEIIELAKRYLQKFKLLDIQKTYAFEKVLRYLNYIPLPTNYQKSVLNATRQIENDLPGVFLTGNYILGPAVEQCLEQAQVTAQKMSEYIFRHQNNN